MTSSTLWLHLFLFLLLALAGCGRGAEVFPTLTRSEAEPQATENLIRDDPKGPIPKPVVPALTASTSDQAGPVEERIIYKVTIKPDNDPEIQAITPIFVQTAELYVLADKPVTNPMTLTRRLRSSLTKGEDILKSKGYYEGQVTGWMEKKDEAKETTVVVNFQLGPLYRLGQSQVTRTEPKPILDPNATPNVAPAASGSKTPLASPKSDLNAAKNAEPNPNPLVPAVLNQPQEPAAPPTTDLTQAGWVEGEPALAEKILAIVETNAVAWTALGYPNAKTAATHYYLDPEKKLLNAEIEMDPGFFALMGPLEVISDGQVATSYVLNLVTWKVGQVWDQLLVDRFVESLFQTGLFKTVDPVLGEPNAEGQRPIVVTLSATQFRTISGSLNFDSDFGPGVSLAWEHRNFTGHGDRLRLEFPAWADLIQFGASYIRPYFLSKRQSLLLDLSLIREKAEAYTLEAVSAAGGVERRLTRRLSGLFQVSLEAGKLAESEKPKATYTIYGLPIALDWDHSDDFLNPTRGSRVKVTIQPYTGNYFNEFQVLKSRLDASHYLPLTQKGQVVLAVRGAAGGIWGAKRTDLPATLRFYGGGGGSMRGYEYQSVGPKNERNRPDGGGAMAEVSGEVRLRFSESLGATAFVDGGMVYDRPDFSQVGKAFLWGGGVGFRYFTPIGPFRLDLATPLTPRPEDGPLQFYLSLGQSF